MNATSLYSLAIKKDEDLPFVYIKFHNNKDMPSIICISKTIENDCIEPITFSVKVSRFNSIYVAINSVRDKFTYSISNICNNEFAAYVDDSVIDSINKLIPIDNVLILPLHKVFRNGNTVIYIVNGNNTEIVHYPLREDFNDINFNCCFISKRL